MALDFQNPNLERQLEASLAQQEAQANETRALLARLKHSTIQSAYPLTDASFQYTTSSAPVARHGSRPVPSHGASKPHVGQPAPLYQQDSYTPMKRVKTCQPGLQQSMPGSTDMVRSKSSYATPNPFTAGPGSVRPVPVSQNQSSMNNSITSHTEPHQPPNTNIAHSMVNFTDTQPHGTELFPLMENGSMSATGTMENPGDFLQRLQGAHIPRNQRTIPLYGQDPSMHVTAYHQVFQPQDLSPSQCGSLTSGPTFSEMSRTNSNANQSVTGPMIGFDSQSSFADSISSPEFSYSPDQQPSPNKKRSAPSEDVVVGTCSSSPPGQYASYPPVHMGRSTSIDSRLSSGTSQHAPATLHRHLSLQSRSMRRSESQLSRQSFVGTMQGAPMQQGESMMRAVSGSSDGPTPSQRELSQAIRDAAAKHGESMVRTISASSAKSTQSQRQQRHNEALKSHIAHAEMQPLAPKPKVDSNPTLSQSDAKMGIDGKVAMPRTSGYQRPKRPKISCDQCDENPDGFRGEHELRRHKDLKHSKEYKRFVCRIPSQLGAESDLQPIYPLDKCKHCTSNKEYGQYYNAAAHLRRAHFTKKPPRASRSKNAHANGNDEPNEKRGGKGGGDWPPMSELKAKWMEEIKSAKPANDAAATSSDEENPQEIDMYEGHAYPGYMGGAPTGFDDTAASFVGSNTNLQVQNSDVYTDTFNADLNYTTSSTLHEYDASMLSSTGSANFDFNPSSASHGGFPSHDFALDLSLTAAFQSPNNSTSTATLTPFQAFSQEGQFAQKASGPIMMAQQDMLEDMDFGLAMGAEYDDTTFQRP